MCFIVIAIVRTIRNAFAYVQLQQGTSGFWPVLFVFFFLVHATGEASLVRRDDLTYFLFVVLSTSLVLRRQEARSMRRVRLGLLRHGVPSPPQLPAPALAPD
jgi:hypothetical protein